MKVANKTITYQPWKDQVLTAKNILRSEHKDYFNANGIMQLEMAHKFLRLDYHNNSLMFYISCTVDVKVIINLALIETIVNKFLIKGFQHNSIPKMTHY